MTDAVVVGLSGGLGNQMFQYAAGRALALRLGAPLALDVSWFSDRAERQFGLDGFVVDGRVLRPLPLPPGLVRLESRMSRRWGRLRHGVPIFRERHFRFDTRFDLLGRPVFLEGFWQSERYFATQGAAIREDFLLAQPLRISAQRYLDQISTSDAICVHVRRGDYVSNPVAADTHGTCSPRYYSAAVADIADGLSNPHCFVFSDEPAWARDNLTLGVPATYVDANSASEPHWDIALMSACRHFVIANSSLSWWAAWLGNAQDKRVIAPSPWFKDPTKDTRDLLPAAWRTLVGS